MDARLVDPTREQILRFCAEDPIERVSWRTSPDAGSGDSSD